MFDDFKESIGFQIWQTAVIEANLNIKPMVNGQDLLPPGGGFIVFTASMVKINNGNRSDMVGTDGVDSFDSGTCAQTGYFNNNLLVNYLAGGGNDEMGACQQLPHAGDYGHYLA